MSRDTSWRLKNSPSMGPLKETYCSVSVTGQTSVPILPTYTSMPAPTWSHFDRLRCILIDDGGEESSTATCPQARCTLSLNAEADGVVSSPGQKNQKKQRAAAAFSITRSYRPSSAVGGRRHAFINPRKIGIVMGMCLSVDTPP